MGTLSPSRPMRLGPNGVFVDDAQAASESIQGEDIEIRVEVVSLNAVDVEGDNASLVGENIGREAVVVISRLGSKVVDFKLGNTVLMLQQGCLATHLRQNQAFVAHLSRTLSVEDSVALPRVFSVAWHALIDVGRLGKGPVYPHTPRRWWRWAGSHPDCCLCRGHSVRHREHGKEEVHAGRALWTP
jgi:NADPH:quinone reductase-like Zn-dependent oxidoreductase